MICPHCQSDNSADSVSCWSCGARFASADETQDVRRSAAPAEARPPATSGPPRGRTGTTPPSRTPQNSPTWGAAASSLSGAALKLEPGTEFGSRYQIEAVLGEGGMGTVYKARDVELDRTVALKLVRPELATDPATMQRFKQELLLASRVSHKNILRIHDLGEVSGLKFISMAYVEGEDLHTVLKKSGRLPVARAVKFTRQLCAALDAAHAEGVIHRDLKPQNIMIDQSDNAYISDFGLAKSLEGDAAMMTRTGQILGTPRYMSPEQVEAKPADGRSDLYSLGIILYEMVTGDVPFPGTSMVQVMYQRVTQEPKNPKLLCPDLPDYLVGIILRCLERDPEKRYQTARQILQDLDAGQLNSAGSLSIPAAAAVRPKRTGWMVAGGGLLVLILAAAIPASREVLLGWMRAGPAAPAKSAAVSAKYLAILPFGTVGDAETSKYMAEGIAEFLSARLFQLSQVRLASSAAIERINPNEQLPKIAHGLGVTLIVQGTLREAKDKISITLNLEDVAANRRIWSEEFSGLRQDILTIQDQIYNKLVAALGLRLNSQEMAVGASRPTEDLEAYELYLKGRNALRGQLSKANTEKAMGFFNDAIGQDPQFALAFAGLADAQRRMYDQTKDGQWAQKALGAAQQARDLNENLPEVHLSLGSALIATGRQLEGIVEMKSALELAPNSDEGHRRLASAYFSAGRRKEAIESYTKAIEINPHYWFNYNQLGAAYLRLQDNENAAAAFRRAIEIEPDIATGHLNLGIALFQQGKWNECIAAFQKAIAIQPTFRACSNLGTAFFFLGRYRDAADMFEKAVAMNENSYETVGNLADAYRALGEHPRAKTAYDRAIALALEANRVDSRNATTLSSLALYYAKTDNASQASNFIRRARQISPDDPYISYAEAVIHMLAGLKANALASLGEAFQKGYTVGEAQNDPELKTLRADPEFEKLVQSLRKKS